VILKVAVVVLCYNGVDLTMGCLESLQRQDYPDLEIILVDNGSNDGTIPLISQKFPVVAWVKNSKNLGYALGNNKGIEYALSKGAAAVFLVNNDTVLHPSCVSILMKTWQADPKIGILGPMVYTWDNNGTISSAGGKVNWRMAYADNIGMGELDAGQYPSGEVDFINGCGILVRREVLEKVGGLDPKFFMYWEETDWCFRVREAGYKIFFDAKAEMAHKAPIVSQELGPTTLYYLTRNRFLFFSRHTPLSLKPIALLHALDGTLRGIKENRYSGKLTHAKAMQMALQHAVIGHWGQTDPSQWMSAHS
jgi:GT2 family glycosyltransferase